MAAVQVVEAELITVPEAAALARVNEDTIRRWLRRGHIRAAAKGGPSNSPISRDRRHWRINRAEFERTLSLGKLNTPAMDV